MLKNLTILCVIFSLWNKTIFGSNRMGGGEGGGEACPHGTGEVNKKGKNKFYKFGIKFLDSV
jgi:hypothetical protein